MTEKKINESLEKATAQHPQEMDPKQELETVPGEAEAFKEKIVEAQEIEKQQKAKEMTAEVEKPEKPAPSEGPAKEPKPEKAKEPSAPKRERERTPQSSALENQEFAEVEEETPPIPFTEMSLEDAFAFRKGKWAVALAPHMRTSKTTQKVMLDVLIALAPALVYAVYIFGLNALLITCLSVVSAVFFEALIQKAFHKKVLIGDLSAVVTGVLLAFNLPSTAPWWLPIVGAAFAVVIAKEFFGGIGSNFVNPALAGRAALMMSWPTIMTNYVGPDSMTGATPLQILKGGEGTLPAIKDMIIGNIGGVIGETSAALLLLGFLYLVIRKIVDARITVTYLASTMILLFAMGVRGDALLYHFFGGGLILGACFMATDYVTAPISVRGKLIFAVGCGVLTALIRLRGGMPEGVSYSILIMNLAVPLIDRLTIPKVFGSVKKNERNR